MADSLKPTIYDQETPENYIPPHKKVPEPIQAKVIPFPVERTGNDPYSNVLFSKEVWKDMPKSYKAAGVAVAALMGGNPTTLGESVNNKLGDPVKHHVDKPGDQDQSHISLSNK
jgi:hypothetical protein